MGTAKQNATSNTHNDSPCLRDEKRWESAKQNATSSTHNDSPCLRDEEPICRIQLCQSNTHNDSPCLRDEKRWESAMERSTACAVVPDPCRFQRAPCTLSDPQSPAVDIFALADPVRRLTARNIQKIARARPQAASPATLQKIVPYDSRNLTLTNEVSQTPRDCHGRGLGRGRHAATLSASTSRARCQPVAGLHSQWWAAELSMCGQPSSSLD